MDEQMTRKGNLKLYAVYKMFSWDLLFYYAISFLFLTQTKHLSVPSILLADAFYPLFKIFFQLICIALADHIGKRKALLLGNLCVSAAILILILGHGFPALLISNFVLAMGFVLKEMCEPTLLDASIPEAQSKADIFTKIDGKGSTYHYYLDAVSSVSTGFLFVINGYLPMIFCFIFCLISTLISYSFGDVSEPEKDSTQNLSGIKALKEYFIDLKHSFKYIFRSSRLKCLLMFSALFYAFLSLYPTFRGNILTDLSVREQYFGIIVAIGQIISGIATKKNAWFHKTFKNRALTWFAFPFSLSMLFVGLAVVCHLHIYLIFATIAIMVIIISIVKGPYGTLIKRYFNSFSNPTISTKIYAAKSIVESFVRILIFLFASFILSITTISYALIIFGVILTLAFLFLLDYMKTRVGLKPEEYDKKDIDFTLLK